LSGVRLPRWESKRFLLARLGLAQERGFIPTRIKVFKISAASTDFGRKCFYGKWVEGKQEGLHNNPSGFICKLVYLSIHDNREAYSPRMCPDQKGDASTRNRVAVAQLLDIQVCSRSRDKSGGNGAIRCWQLYYSEKTSHSCLIMALHPSFVPSVVTN
jgi:hypothetical protein